MKTIIKKILAQSGYRLSKINPDESHPKTMYSAIYSLAKKYRINTIVDVGASNGSWSKLALEHFPNAQYLLIEAQPVHKAALETFVANHKNTHYILAAAGDRQGQIHFDASDPFSGQATYNPYKDNDIEVPVTTIDLEVEKSGLKPPFLIKLDTHGFEVPIFEGALETLPQTDAISVECYNFKISPECLLFYEMSSYLDKLGFRCIDMADPLWRPYDSALWQMDLVFVNKKETGFSHLGYH
jgi:FkbM family methyltransferase